MMCIVLSPNAKAFTFFPVLLLWKTLNYLHLIFMSSKRFNYTAQSFTSGAAMLSPGLASSNLSCDFSLASRAASFTSLNWSANCKRGEEPQGYAQRHLGRINKPV